MAGSGTITTDKTKENEGALPAASSPAATEPAAASPQGAQPAASQPAADAAAITRPKHDKTGANILFNAFNFLGLHWVGNSTLSLWITYNVVPKPATQKFLHGVAKLMTPIAEGIHNLKSGIGLGKLSNITKEMKAHQINQSARSFTETLCMCIAGSVILLPVKWLEDNRTSIVNKTDDILNPEHKKERLAAEEAAKKQGITLPPEEDTHHKETWTNLIRARLLALVPIFAIDGQIQAFNNARAAAGKANVDTYLWKKGAEIYDGMAPSTRESFIKFFSSKGVTRSSIQPLVQEELIRTVGNDTSKMIFAEQTRMFSKEVYLTLIYTGFLFLLGKTSVVPWTMEKLGISKKTENELEDAIEADIGLDVLPFNNPDKRNTPKGKQPLNGKGKHHADEKKPADAPAKAPAPEAKGFAKDITPRKMPVKQPGELHTTRLDKTGQSHDPAETPLGLSV